MAIGKSSIARAANTARSQSPVSRPVEVPSPTAVVTAELVPPEVISYLSKDERRKAAPSSSLVQSIQESGILEPLLVAALPDGTLILLCGHQRLAAARLCKLSQVPIVRHAVADRAEAAQLASAVCPFATGVDLQEEKFTAVSSIRSDLPPHLL